MPEPLSPRTRARLSAALLPIEALLEGFCDRLDDRRTPLPPGIRDEAETLLRAARRVVSRDPAAAQVPALHGAGPMLPGELVVVLLKASAALHDFARRHDAGP